jgi:chromosome segregation ATPase
MRNLIIFILLVAVAIGGVGYWRGWFTVDKEGGGGHEKVNVNQAKFDQDKKAFSKTVSEDAGKLKSKIENLFEKAKGLTGDEKVKMQKELDDLMTKHDRLQQQIKKLDDVGEDKFKDIEADLKKDLADVEKKIDELSKKLEKGKDK